MLALVLLQPAAGQYLNIELAGPAEGVTQPWKTMFHSHNQKVVENANGIFCTSHGVALDRSTNGGQTFTNVYDRNLDHEAYRPPTLETDEDNNLYLIYPNVDNSKTRFEKFTPANGYTSPTIVTEHSQATSAAKFASAYDPGRARLYHATQGGYLFTFDKSGNFVAGKQIWTTGSTGAVPQYPHLFLDTGGVLHFAQTTVDGATGLIYETIRYLKSTDGGATWRKMDGTVVSTPVSCDPDSTNSTEISLEDEEAGNTWLANMFVKNGKVHFMYLARNITPERQHYMRFDAATGMREIDSSSDFPGGVWSGGTLTINSWSGCFASDHANPNAPLVAIAGVATDRIGALVSRDNGSTWQDYARSADVDMLDNVGSFRFSPKYGRVIGSFSGAPGGVWATALFYQFPIETPPLDRTWRNNVEDANKTQWLSWKNWDSLNNPPDTSGERAVFASSATAKSTVIDWSGGNQFSVGGILFSSSGWQVNQQNPASQLGLAGYSAGTNHMIIENTAASGENIIGARLVLAVDNAGINVAGGGTVTIAGVIDDGTSTFGLVKSGTGMLTISGANSYGGGTTVNAGTLNVSSNQGAATGSWTIGKGNATAATVNFQSGSTVATAAGKTIQVGSIPGDTFASTAAQALNVAGTATNDGTLAIGRNATVSVSSGAIWTQNGGMALNGVGGYSAALNVNAGGLLTYTGGSSIKVNPAAGNSGNSTLTIGGSFVTGQGFERTATGTTGSGRVSLNGGVLRLASNVTDLTVNSTAMPFTLSLGGSGGTIDTAGHTAAITGVLSGSGGLTKIGAGTLTLSGNNSYSGNTTISNGTLLVNNTSGSGTGAGAVTVNTGGTLGGTGIISGIVTNDVGGTLSPGASIGSLTFNGNVVLNAGSTNTFEVNGTGPANDQVVVGGTVTYGGVLKVVASGNFTGGQSFTLFSGAGAAVPGNFSSIQVSPAGPTFSFTNGVLTVVSTGSSPSPTVLTNRFGAGVLSLSWPSNQGWRLLQQTSSLRGASTQTGWT